jgi:Tfp pilus assembly protein PilO
MKLRSEQILTVALVLGVAGLFVFTVHLPQKRHLKQLEQDYRQQEENLQKAKEEYSQLAELNKKVTLLRNVVNRLYKRMPAKGEFGSSLEKIVAGMNASKLVTEEISPQSPVSTEKFSELPIKINFKGSFENICTFLAGLENLDRLIRIENLRLEGDAGPTPVIKAKMVLNVYCSRS